MNKGIEFSEEIKAYFNSRSVSMLEYCICKAKLERPIVICDGRIWGYEKEEK